MSGVLAGITASNAIDFTRCEYFVGTSAGAVVAAGLAAGLPPSGPTAGESEPAAAGEPPATGESAETGLSATAGTTDAASPLADDESPPADGHSEREFLESAAWAGLETAAALAGPWIRLGLAVTEPVGALARATALRFLPDGTGNHDRLRATLEAMGSEFDGRLRIVAVDRESGHRVVFGSPGAPVASVADAVAASCAVPTKFAPQPAGGGEFVDGGVWSATNLDAAPAHRGAQVLCLSPTASVHGPLNIAVRGASRAATLLEIAAARSSGAEVELITPDRASAAAIGPDPLDAAGIDAVLAAGYAQGLAL